MASSTSGNVNKYNFVEELDSALECVICLDVAEDPRQHVGQQCGRLFCKGCLEKLGNKPCPNCRGEDPQFFVDHKSNREIKALRVKCSNVERGCEWVGTVGTLEKHATTCDFKLVPCPKQCKDDNDTVECFMKKDLNKHLENDCPNRDHECEHCGEKGTYAYITEVHDTTCKMKILPCPNYGCNTKIQRQNISEHVSKCPYTVIPCKYKGIGCGTELKREDMEAHEQDDKLHLHMALDTVNSLQETVEVSQTLKDSKSVTYVFPEYQKNKDSNVQFTFPNSFYTHTGGYHITLEVDANGYGDGMGTHVSVFVGILKGKYDAGLKWPFVGSVTLKLLNQLEDDSHKTSILSFNIASNRRVGNAWGYPTFIPHSELAHDPVKNIQYLKDDTLYFKVKVEVADHKPWLE